MSEAESHALAPVPAGLPTRSQWETMREIAYVTARTAFAASWGQRPESVMAAILQGREWGLGPMASLVNIHVIEGKPSASAELQLALIRRAGHIVQPKELTRERALLHYKRRDTGEEGDLEFTFEEAKAAGLAGKANWQKYTKQMLWARVVSMASTMVFSDVALGMHTADELGAESTDEGGAWRPDPNVPEGFARAPQPRRVDADGVILQGEVVDPAPAGAQPEPAPAVESADTSHPRPAPSVAAPRGNPAGARGVLPMVRNETRVQGTVPPAAPADAPAPAPDLPKPAAPNWFQEGDRWFIRSRDGEVTELPPQPTHTCVLCLREEKAMLGIPSEWRPIVEKGSARWMCANGHLARKPKGWEPGGAAPSTAEEPEEGPAPAAGGSHPGFAQPAPAEEDSQRNFDQQYLLRLAVALKRQQLTEFNAKARLNGQPEAPIGDDESLRGPAREALDMYAAGAFQKALVDLNDEDLPAAIKQLQTWLQQRNVEIPQRG